MKMSPVYDAVLGVVLALVCITVSSEDEYTKVCSGIEEPEFLHVYNVRHFRGCTKINGSIRIVQTTFDGDEYFNRPGMHPDALWAFSEVREITGFLLFQGRHPHLRRINHFRKLETVGGEELSRTFSSSVSIMVTSAESLELSSLRNVVNGNVLIYANTNLCYVKAANFDDVVNMATQRVVVSSNAPHSQCALTHQTCSSRCEKRLCWGQGLKNCVKNIDQSNAINDVSVKNFLPG